MSPAFIPTPWGCEFVNIHRGIIGEVKRRCPRPTTGRTPIRFTFREEWLSFDTASVNDFCKKSEKFITCGACPRPFEQLQFIRGTVNLYMDLMDPPAE